MKFYATCYFGKGDDRTVYWMPDDVEYKAMYDEWAHLLGLDGYDGPSEKIHDTGVSKKVDDFNPLYPNGKIGV